MDRDDPPTRILATPAEIDIMGNGLKRDPSKSGPQLAVQSPIATRRASATPVEVHQVQVNAMA
ncbi:MAG: hypothetical protein U0790_22380 [Isosphaeraceae bacterium]